MQPANCSVNATIDLLVDLLGKSRDDCKLLVYRNMDESWYKATRDGGPGVDLTLLYVHLLDLFEALDLDEKYQVQVIQLNGKRTKEYSEFETNLLGYFTIVNFNESDITQDDENEGHFEYPRFENGKMYLGNLYADTTTLFNSMRSIDPDTDQARGYILIKERGS